MSIAKRTSKATYRIIGAGLLLTLATVIATASAWNGGFGWIDLSKVFAENQTAERTAETNAPNAALVIGTCDTAGPIEIESTGGTTTPTAYATLKAAFDATNAGTHTGTINVEVCGNTVETAPAVLNSSGAGSASYTAVLIRPLLDGLTISGATTTGRGLIELNGADNVTINGDNSNTAGTNRNLTITNTAANTVTYTSVIRIALATSVVTSADNNTIRNLNLNGSATGRNISTATSTTGTENASFGVLVGSGASTVAATTAPAATTSVTPSVGTPATAANLTVDNNSINTVARGVFVALSSTTGAPNLEITANSIGNPTVGATNQVYSYGIGFAGSTNAVIRQNTVYVESFIATALRGIDVGTISSNVSGATFDRNMVNRVQNNNANGAYGINLGGGSSHTVRNNFVSGVITGTSGFFSTTSGGYGIRASTGTEHQIYHNSVNMYGTPTGTTLTFSAALGFTSTLTTGADIRNNILANSQSGGTAASAFVSLALPSSTLTSSYNLTLNNNDYFEGPNAQNGIAQAGFTSGTGFYKAADFNPATTTPAANLRSYTSTLNTAGTNDDSSKVVNPQFVSNTDLHISATSPVVDMGAAVDAGRDIDGEIRIDTPDIGADETDGMLPPANDIAATAIIVPASGSIFPTGATITPQASFTNVGTATQTNVMVQFTIFGPSFTYINSQTIASIDPNQTVTVTFATTPPLAEEGMYAIRAAVLTADANPANDEVVGSIRTVIPFTGNVNVGTGQTYTSLTNAGGLFEALNGGGASGNITINITSDLTGENGEVALNELSGGFTVTIRPSGAARTITGSSTNSIIRLNGADNVTIEGSLTGGTATGVGGDAALRNLTVQNTSTTATGGAVIAVFQGTGGAQDVTIRNVNVLGQDPTQTLVGIHVGGNAVGTSPTVNNNNSRIENCSIQRVILGIFNNGAMPVSPATGTVITTNDMSATGPNRVRRAGIFFFNQNGIQVTRNSIGGINTDEGADAIGIIAGTQNVISATTAGGGVSNANISRNRINGVVSSSTVGFSAAGIAVAGGTLGANTIANNMITGVSAPSTSPDLTAGIFVASATGSDTRLYYNSISMTGDRGTVATQTPSFGIAYTADVALELKNNIFYTTQTSGGGANAKSYAIGTLATTFANLNSNYNDFFSSGANDGGFRSGSLAGGAGTDYVDLAAWRTATGGDANSLEVDPLFVNPLTDLHLTATSPVIDAGTPITAVTDDFDGQTRPMMGVDIGADELVTAVPGTLALSAATYTVAENVAGGTATITVNRTGGTDGAVSVAYTLTDGTATGGAACGGAVDFVNTSGTVNFASGEASQTFTVTICDDSVFEGDETFNVILGATTGGATVGTPSTAVVTITDNEVTMPGTLALSAATYTVAENVAGGTITITVNRTGGTDGAVSVAYALTDGTATGGAACGGAVDFVNTGGTLNFAAGVSSQTFTVAICDDTTIEPNETFTVTLSGATGGATIGTPATATVTITDNDTPPAAGNVVVNPGNIGYATLKEAFDAINAGTHTGAVTVDIFGDTTETATASLNASGTGSTSYTSVVMRPVGGPRTVEGTLSGTATGAIVKLNGADNVTIDGRQGGTGTARDLTIRNNSNATGAAAVWLSSLAADAGATNNIIRNLELACGPANANANNTFGIIMSGTTMTPTANGNDNDNNQFIFNRIISARYGIITRGVTTNNNIAPIVSDNIIGPSTGFGPDQIAKTGILMQADTDAIVSRNTIQFVGGEFANTTAGSDRVGIGIGTDVAGITSTTTITSGDYTVTRNIIHDVVEARTFTAAGIVLGTTRGGAATDNLVANNFVYNIRANGTLGDHTVGIEVNGGNGDDIVFNSISLTGDVDPPTASAPTTMFGSGIRITGANGTNNANFTVANNSILMDLSSDTATVHFYAITLNNAAYSFGTGFLNNNNYFINPANPQLFTGGLASVTGAAATTEFATLANWQGALTPPQDANSIQANPQYVSNTADLHIAMGSPNVNAGVAAGGVLDDIDGQLRVGIPDIGADEPGGTAPAANDIAAISIVSPATGSTIPTGNTVTPQARFRNVGTATQTNVMVQFTITGPGGFNYTDTQTIASIDPNQTITVTFATTPVLTAVGTYTTTAAVITSDANPANDTVMGSFNTIAPFNGNVNVGTVETFTSLTNPGGIFEALNLAGASGNVTINITSDLTAETGAVALEEIAGGFTVTIKPSGAARTISGSTAATIGLIKLSGADNVTIDGSLNGGTDRSLTISTTLGAIIWITTDGTNGSNNNTVKNTVLFSSGTGQGIIAGSGTTLGGAGTAPQNDNTIQNNAVRAVQNAAFISGIAATDQNWTIVENEVGSTVDAEKLSFRGFILINSTNMTVSRNRIIGVRSGATSTATMSGVQVSGTISGGMITRNEIRDIKQINPTGFGSNGVYSTASSTTSNLLIANNFISDVASQGATGVLATNNGYGIAIAGGGGYNIYYNSVNMNTNQVNAASTTAALNITVAVTTAGSIDLRNNILVNTQTVGTRYAVIDNSTQGAAVFSMINYNDYFAANVGLLGTPRVTLADWQTATGQDVNSKAVDPLFVSATDLHLQTMSPLLDMGTPIVAVTDDFDGQTRSLTTPDIGADEVAAIVTMPGTLALSSATYTVGEGDGTVTVTVNRTGGTDGAVSVAYTLTDGSATGGAACGGAVDYVNTGGTVMFADGQSSQTFTVAICDDMAVEMSETFNVILGATTGGATVGMPAMAVVTITDNDTPVAGSIQFSSSSYTGRENGAATITVTRTGGTTGTDTVDYATSNGTAIGGAACTAGIDYISTSGTLTFAPGATSQVFNVTLCPDATFKPAETINLTLSNATGNSTLGTPSAAVLTVIDKRRVRNDFDGDGKTDAAVFRASDNAFYILQSADSTFRPVNFGAAGDIPVTADYDGDGKTDVAVFRPSQGAWYLLESGTNTVRIEFWGLGTDYTVPGDYDGDGKADVAVWRESDGTWYVKRSSNGSQLIQAFGQTGDRPLIGDFDNDGKTELTVVRAAAGASSPATVYSLNTTSQTFTGTVWGVRSDNFVIGDYDGDGSDDITVYRPSEGNWYIRKSSDSSLLAVTWGISTDIPTAGDYDGDGRTDFTVWRPSTAIFYTLFQTGGQQGLQWGISTDDPLSTRGGY